MDGVSYTSSAWTPAGGTNPQTFTGSPSSILIDPTGGGTKNSVNVKVPKGVNFKLNVSVIGDCCSQGSRCTDNDHPNGYGGKSQWSYDSAPLTYADLKNGSTTSQYPIH